MLKFSKEKQLKSWKRKKSTSKVEIKEEAIQKQANDLLNANQIDFIRIPDGCWTWLKLNAPKHVLIHFQQAFRHMADNVCRIKVSEKHALEMNLELKTVVGRLSGGQKKRGEKTGLVVSRSPDETIKAVEEFQAMASVVELFLKELEMKNETSKTR